MAKGKFFVERKECECGECERETSEEWAVG